MTYYETKDVLTVEVYSPPVSGAFVWDVSSWGDDWTEDGVTYTPDSYSCDASSVSIQRGGSNDAIVPSLDVGTMSLGWYGKLPDSLLGVLQPNYRIRCLLDGAPIFTGKVKGIASVRDKDTQRASRLLAENLFHDPFALGSYALGTSNATFVRSAGEFVATKTGGSGTAGYGALRGLVLAASTTYTVSFDYRFAGGVQVYYRPSSGTTTTTGQVNLGPLLGLTQDNAWHRATATFTTTATAPAATPAGLVVQYTASTAPGAVASVRNVSVRSGSVPAAGMGAFSGDTAPVVNQRYAWTGTAYASSSTRTEVPLSSVTITAVDQVAPLANKTRFGAVTSGGAGHETWTARVNRLKSSTSVPFVLPTDEQRYLKAIFPQSTSTAPMSARNGGTAPTLFATTLWPSRRLRMRRADSSGASVPSGVGLRYSSLGGLIVGREYVLVQRVVSHSPQVSAFNVNIEGASGFSTFTCEPTLVATDPSVPEFWDTGVTVETRFTASSTSHWFEVVTAEDTAFTYNGSSPYAGYSVSFSVQPNLYLVASGTEVQDVAFEGSLKDHLDMVTNSAGAVWWPDAEGQVRFAKDPTTPVERAHFDDVHDETDPLHVCMSEDAVEAYDTEQIVNNLTVENHGRDAGTGNTNDTTTLFTSDTSDATFGPQEQSIDTCVYDQGLFAGSLATLASDLLIRNDTPQVTVAEVSYDVLAHVGVARIIDLYSKVTVYGVPYLVWGITHDVTPTSWTSTLSLRKAAS